MPGDRTPHPDASWTELVATDADCDAADPDLLTGMFQQLVLIRAFEEYVLELAAAGLVHGPAHSSIGQEPLLDLLATRADLDHERVNVPAYYVTGAKDRLVPWQQTQRQAVVVCCPDGNHGVSKLPSIAPPTIADWMPGQLRRSGDDN